VALGDQRRLGQVSAYLSQYFWQTGDQEQAIEAAERARAIAVAIGDFGLHVTSTVYLGAAYHILGDYRRAIDCFRKVLEFLEGKPLGERFGAINPLAVISRTQLCCCLAEVGEFAEGSACGEEGVRIAEAIDHPPSRVAAYLRLGFLYFHKGDLHRAISAFERGLALCQVTDIPSWPSQIASVLAAAYAQSGRVSAALPLLDQALEQTVSKQTMLYHTMWLPWLNEAALLANRIDQAIHLAGRGLTLSRERKERGREAYALRFLGEIHMHREPPEVGRPKPTTVRPSLWPRSWACVRSRPTATVAWARCMPRPARRSRPALR